MNGPPEGGALVVDKIGRAFLLASIGVDSGEVPDGRVVVLRVDVAGPHRVPTVLARAVFLVTLALVIH
ncbi:hypothetical protein D3C85_1880680 [compost metagenome]